MTERLLPIATLTDALTVALAAAQKIGNPMLTYLIEMAVTEAATFADRRQLDDLKRAAAQSLVKAPLQNGQP